MPGRAYTPDHLVEGGETIDAAGISFECIAIPGHSPAHVAYYTDGALFSGDLLFAGSVGRVDLPGGDWDTLVASVKLLADTLSGRDRRLPRARAGDDARRRARAQSVPRGAARLVSIERPRGTNDILPTDAPLWRRVTQEIEAVAATVRLRLDPHAGVRGHRSLPTDVRRGLRRRAEGDVHLRGQGRPQADTAPGGARRRSAGPISSTACIVRRSR